MWLREKIVSGNVLLSLFLVLWALVLMLATASHADGRGLTKQDASSFTETIPAD